MAEPGPSSILPAQHSWMGTSMSGAGVQPRLLVTPLDTMGPFKRPSCRNQNRTQEVLTCHNQNLADELIWMFRVGVISTQ